MIAPAEATADVGIGAGRVLLAQVHGDLARAGDGAGPALAQQIGLLQVEVVGDRLLDLVHRDAALGPAAQGDAQQALRLVHAQGGQAGAGDGGQGVHGAFKLTHRAGGAVHQMFQNIGAGLARHDAQLGQGVQTRLGHGDLQIAVGGFDRAGQAGGQVAAQARLHVGQGGRGAVGRQDDAFAVLDQRGQGAEQFFLRRGLAADELHVVQQQHVGRAQAFLEGRGRAVLHGAHEGREETLGGQIDHLGVGAQALRLPGDGVQQVGLAVAVGAAEEDRVEVAVGPAGDLLGDGQRKGVALALDEAVEGQALLQAGGAHGAGAVGRRRKGGGGHGRGGDRGGDHAADRGQARGLAGGEGGGRGGRPHLGAAADVQTARQAVQAQPQLVHATQGVLAHPVPRIGRRRHQDQIARPVETHGRRRDVAAERTIADLGLQAARRLSPNTVWIRHARHRAPQYRQNTPAKS